MSNVKKMKIWNGWLEYKIRGALGSVEKLKFRKILNIFGTLKWKPKNGWSGNLNSCLNQCEASSFFQFCISYLMASVEDSKLYTL